MLVLVVEDLKPMSHYYFDLNDRITHGDITILEEPKPFGDVTMHILVIPCREVSLFAFDKL